MNLAECPACGNEMKYIHEHDECWSCGLVIGCCEGTTIGVARTEETEDE